MITSQGNRVTYDLTGGLVGEYSIPFRFWANQEIKVYLLRTTGEVTLLEEGDTKDYTITNTGSGGTLTRKSGWGDSHKSLTIYREIPITQETDYAEGGVVSMETLEADLDRAAARDQQLQEKISRVITTNITDESSGMELPSKEERKGKWLYFDDTTGSVTVTEKWEVSGVFPLPGASGRANRFLGFDSAGAVELRDLDTQYAVALTLTDSYLSKKNPFSYSENKLVVSAPLSIPVYNSSTNRWVLFTVVSNVEITESHLDTGTFDVGKDYYVYACDNDGALVFRISLNATYPLGFTGKARKIGGFHFGHIRKVSDDGLWVPVDGAGQKFGSGTPNWKDNVTVGIVPNSVWDLKNRPKCSPEGMVKVGHIWVDIYMASAAESITFENGTGGLHVASGRLQSKYGQVPVSGTEGLNWYGFNELAARSGKRLLTYGEWIKAAYGNPQGLDSADTYGWTKTTNNARARTGCQVNNSTGTYDPTTGIKPAAISAYNIVDAVGNLYEWLDELSNRHDSTSWAWQDVLGSGKGQAYLPNSTGLVAYIAGANWNWGVRAGPRTINVSRYLWYANTAVGSRLACDSL